MRTITKPYTIDGFDYSGDVNMDYYTDAYEGYLNRAHIFGNNALAGANWDLQTMSNRYKLNPTPEMAAMVRAQWLVVHDLEGETW